MWKEEILKTNFPFVPNCDEDAETILFENKPARTVLLKWIYNLINGLEDDISSNELMNYFDEIGTFGLWDNGAYDFFHDKMPKKEQNKIWNSLFQLAGMMECSPDIMKLFFEKFHQEMASYPVNTQVCSGISISDKPLPPFPDWDKQIAELEEVITMPADSPISKENKMVLKNLKEYINQLKPLIQKHQKPTLEEINKLKELSDAICSFHTTIQSSEMELKSIVTACLSLRSFERRLDEHIARSDNNLKIAVELGNNCDST